MSISHSRFAKDCIRALRRAGVGDPVRLDRRRFRVHVLPPGRAPLELDLRAPYELYLAAPPAGRAGLLAQLARTALALRDGVPRAEALRCLRPAVIPRWVCADLSGLAAAAGLPPPGPEPAPPEHAPVVRALGDHLDAGLDFHGDGYSFSVAAVHLPPGG